MENNIWKNTEILKIHPLSLNEAFHFLEITTKRNIINNDAIIGLVNIFNTPLMLKLLVDATNRLGIPIEEATGENFVLSFIS